MSKSASPKKPSAKLGHWGRWPTVSSAKTSHLVSLPDKLKSRCPKKAGTKSLTSSQRTSKTTCPKISGQGWCPKKAGTKSLTLSQRTSKTICPGCLWANGTKSLTLSLRTSKTMCPITFWDIAQAQYGGRARLHFPDALCRKDTGPLSTCQNAKNTPCLYRCRC